MNRECVSPGRWGWGGWMFGSMEANGAGKWIKVYCDELHYQRCSSFVKRIIISVRMRWVEYVARVVRVKLSVSTP